MMRWRLLQTFAVLFIPLSGMIVEPKPDDAQLIALVKKSDRYFDNLRFDSAIVLYQKILNSATHKDTLYFRAVNNLTECLWWQNNGFDAEQIARANLPMAIRNLGATHPLVGRLYLNLAVMSFITSNGVMTEEYLQKALQITIKNYGLIHASTAKVYEWLGTYYESFSDKSESFDYLRQSLRIWLKIRKSDSPDLGNIYRYLGLYYKRFAKHDSAMYFFNKAQHVFEKKYGRNNFQSVKCINNKCDLYEDAGKFKEALALYDDALNRIMNTHGETKMVHIMTLFNLSEHFSRRGDPVKALDYIQQIFLLYFPGFNVTNTLINPTHVEAVFNYYLKLVYVWKSRYLKEAFKKNPSHPVEYLYSSLQCDSLISRINFLLKTRIINYDDLLTFEQTHSNLYFGFATDALAVYANTHDQKYVSMALEYLEQNRNMQLVKRVDSLSTPFDIPREIALTRQTYQSGINNLMNLLEVTNIPSAKREIENKILDKKIELDQYYYSVFRTGNKFARSLFSENKIQLETIRNKLDNNTIILEVIEIFPDYKFVPDQFLFLCLTKTGFNFSLVNGHEIFPQLRRFSSLISSPLTSVTDIDSNGFYLYKKIFKPFEKLLVGNTKLVIIPSPDTWMIPFEALSINNRPTRDPSCYLFNQYIVQKEYSLLAWLETEKIKKRTNIDVLAVAPRFNNSIKSKLAQLTKRDTSMIDLPGSRKECRDICDIFPTKLVAGYDATKQRFISLASHYQVIHLSTHGIPSEGNDNIIMLAFNQDGDDKIQHNCLNLYEILNLNLKSDLVVLSACKSALGTKNKSEGNLNIAWAFKNAGATSVVVSLWDVNDYASSIIMPSFYRNMAEGQTKPEALRKAKLDFIRLSDKSFKHPYYWASFDYIGNDLPLLSKSTDKYKFPAWMWILMMLLIIIPSGLIINNIRKK